MYSLFLLGTSLSINAQISEHSLPSNPDLQNIKAHGIQVRSDQALTLPFADDFSDNVGYPNPAYWEDRQVYINRSLGLNPPSIGVATLDGLDAQGLPYGGGYGGSDTLTSHPIDLSGEHTAYLSFYVQPKGIGYLPQKQDSLIVEAKSVDGAWQSLEVFEGLDDSYINQSAPEFQRVSIQITADFLHSEFQFRFRNYSKNRGLESLWHLDYVMVTSDEPDLYIEDITFTAPPAYLVKRYTAFPLSQIILEPQRLNDQLPIHLRNNSRDRFTIDTSRVEIFNTANATTVFKDESLLEIPPIVNENQRNINPGSVQFTNTFNTSGLADYLGQVTDEGVTLTSEYEYVMRAEKPLPTFQSNNRVAIQTRFDNFMAYDDNSVEGSISTYNGNGITTRIAIEYEMIEADSLQSIRILFPYLVEDYEDKEFNLLIFVGELKSEADYTLHNLKPKRGSHFQPFTEYVVKDYLPEGIEVPAGKFYIGWEHPRGTTTDYIPFGFDKNYPDANKYIYYNVGGDWLNVATSSPTLQGAIAIRPVVGRKELLTHTSPQVEDLSHLVFPNPTNSILQFKSGFIDTDLNFKIYNSTGRLSFSGSISKGEKQLHVSHLPPGIYFIQLSTPDQTIYGQIRFIKH